MLLPYSMNSQSILITNVLNSVSDKLAISVLFSSFWGFILFFHLGHIYLSSQFSSIPVFVSVYEVELLWLPVKAPVNCVWWSLLQLPEWGNLLHCFVALCGEKVPRGDCAAVWFLVVCPAPTPFPVISPYAIGALSAVALVLNPRVGGFAYVISLCRPFKWSTLKIWQFLLLLQHPLVFTARSYGDFSSQHCNPGLCSLTWGWDLSLPRYPSWFLSTTHECGAASACFAACLSMPHWVSLPLCTISVSPPLPPPLIVSMNVASLNPWLLDFHTVRFSDGSGCYLFWDLVVILFVVVWEGRAFLPMPPSWPEVFI